MHAFRDRVVGDDEAVEERDVVEQTARFGRSRKPPQPIDDLGLAHDQSARAGRASLAMESSRPFTNPLSRLSKKAWATSTYSEMTDPTGTSARATSSEAPARRIARMDRSSRSSVQP